LKGEQHKVDALYKFVITGLTISTVEPLASSNYLQQIQTIPMIPSLYAFVAPHRVSARLVLGGL